MRTRIFWGLYPRVETTTYDKGTTIETQKCLDALDLEPKDLSNCPMVGLNPKPYRGFMPLVILSPQKAGSWLINWRLMTLWMEEILHHPVYPVLYVTPRFFFIPYITHCSSFHFLFHSPKTRESKWCKTSSIHRTLTQRAANSEAKFMPCEAPHVDLSCYRGYEGVILGLSRGI